MGLGEIDFFGSLLLEYPENSHPSSQGRRIRNGPEERPVDEVWGDARAATEISLRQEEAVQKQDE